MAEVSIPWCFHSCRTFLLSALQLELFGIRVSLPSTALPNWGHRHPRAGLTAAEG